MGRHTAPMDIPDFWDDDPEIDRKEVKNDRNRAIGAVVLCLALTGLSGFVGWLFGTGPEIVTQPVRVTVGTTVTDVETVHHTRFRTRTATPEVVTQTVPGPTNTVEVTRTRRPEPRPTVTRTVRATETACVAVDETGEVLGSVTCP